MNVRPQQYDTSLAEFTYTIARNSPITAKRHLPEKLFRAINTEKGAMRFASRSKLEEKIELFSYLGLKAFLIFADVKKGQALNELREIFSQFDNTDTKNSTLKKLSDGNVYITSDKEFIYRLGHMAQVVDTRAYARNQELVRAAYNANKFKSKIYIDEHQAPMAEKEDAAELVKFLSTVLWVNNIALELTSVDSPTLQILMYLYANRQVYVTREKLKEIFAGAISGKQIVASRHKLIETKMAQKEFGETANGITITARGILVVNQFRDKVIKMLDF